MEALLIFWAVVWVLKNATEDIMYAAKGKPSPRRIAQIKRLEQSGGTPRYGLGGFVRDFADDFLRERTEKRRELADRKKAAVKAAAEAKTDRRAAQPETTTRPVATFTPQAQPPHVYEWDCRDEHRQPITAVGIDNTGRIHLLCEGCAKDIRDNPEFHDDKGIRLYGMDVLSDEARAEITASVGPTSEDPDRRVDPLNLNGRPDCQPPKVGDTRGEPGTNGQYRWDGGAWVKTHNADGTEIPKCPKCARPRYMVRGDGCGNCVPITEATVSGPTCHACGRVSFLYDGLCPNCRPTEEAEKTQEEPRQPTPQTPVAPVIPIFGTNPTTNPGGTMSDTAEVTGLQTAIQYAKGVAAAHEQHGTDAEQFAASLTANEVGDEAVGLVTQAQEASNAAASAWEAVADRLSGHTVVAEAYAAAPDAGSRDFNTSE